MKVTFDTNTFHKVTKPERYAKGPDTQAMATIHELIKAGKVIGFMSDTMITLEGVTKADRASVFGGSRVLSQITHSGDTTYIGMKLEQPDRKAVNAKQKERFLDAFGLGMKLLGAPRIGMPRAEEGFYAPEDPTKLGDQLDRFHTILREIEGRGLGVARAEAIAVRFSSRGPFSGPWFLPLRAVNDIHEEQEVARAIAEWADADSIAAHYAYQNDIFCTLDHALAEERRGEPAIFAPKNKAWLTSEFDIKFATIVELAGIVEAGSR